MEYLLPQQELKALYFVATPTQDGIGVARYEGTTSSCTIDNITVSIAEEDRSVNNKGLQVFEQLTEILLRLVPNWLLMVDLMVVII